MTRSPLLSTLLALAPLVVLAVPLSWVLSPAELKPAPPLAEVSKSTLVRCDVLLRSSPPFKTVRINGTVFESGISEKEMLLDLGEALVVDVTWPPGSHESALLIEVIPDHFEMKSHTIWGDESALEELELEWGDAE